MNRPVSTDAKKPNVGRHEIQQKKRLQWLGRYGQFRMPLVIGLIGLTLSLVSFSKVDHWETQLRKSDFEQLAESRCHLIKNEIEWSIARLNTLKQLFAASLFVDRSEFATFLEPLHSQTHHTLSYSWAPRVLDSDRRSFEKAVQAEGYADFSVHCDSPTDSIAVITQHRDYYPVLYHCYHSPLTMGFDMSSRPHLRKAIEKAIDEDRLTVTISATPNERKDRLTLFAFYPIYYMNLPIRTEQERRLASRGIVVSVIQSDDIFRQILGELSPMGINMEIADVSSNQSRRLLYEYKARLHGADTGDDLNEESEASDFAVTTDFEIGDHAWEFRFTPSQGYFDNHPAWQCWTVLLSGLLLTALLVMQLRSMQTRTIMVEKLVIDRTTQLQESTTRFQLAFEIANIAICLRDLDGRFTMVNDQMCTLYGYSREELLSMTMTDITHPEDVHITRCFIQQAILDGIDHRRFVKRCIHKEGHVIWGDDSNSIVRDVKGDPAYLISFILDITELRQSGVDLSEEAVRRRILIDQSRDGIVVLKHDGSVYESNRRFAELLGFSPEEVRRLHVWDWEFLFSPEQVREMLKNVDETGDHFETRHRRKDGSIYDVEVSTNGAVFAGEKLVFCVCRDITERKRAEEALRESELRYRELFDNISSGVAIYEVRDDGEDFIFKEFNKAAERTDGDQRDDLIGKSIYEVRPGIEEFGLLDVFRRVWKTGVPEYYPAKMYQDGQRANWYENSVYRLPTGEIVAVFDDVTERKRAEVQIQRLAMIVEQTSDGIAFADLDGIIQFANNTWAAMHGYESSDELVGGHLNTFHTEEQVKTDVLPFNEKVMRLGHTFGEVGHKRRDGTTFPTQMTVTVMKDEQGRPCGLAAFAKDITERKSKARERKMLEIEMNQARKLEAVGSLAAGIAHEINTPIQFVGDNTIFLYDSYKTVMSLLETYERLWQQVNAGGDLTDLCSEKAKADENADLEYLREEVPSAVDQALEGIHRVTKIVRAMKDCAHSDQGTKSTSNLNKMLESTLVVARNELKYVADVETDFCQELPEYECYRDDLNQVFLNLLVNAAHAIADGVGDASANKGLITVSTLRDNDNIVIRISDTGKGIPRSIRHRIFEPFFSTKDVGRGSGQGLSIARKILVEKHQGSLDFETEEGKGTTFIIRLPLSTHEKMVEVT